MVFTVHTHTHVYAIHTYIQPKHFSNIQTAMATGGENVSQEKWSFVSGKIRKEQDPQGYS